LADVDLEAMLDAQAPGEALAMTDHHGVDAQAEGVGLEGVPVAFLPVPSRCSLSQLLS